MIEGIKLAIDQFIADQRHSHEEVHAGLVEVTDYVGGYVHVLENAGQLPVAADKIE